MQKRRDRRLVSQPGPESLPSQLHLPSLKVTVAASSSRRCISITAATSGRRPPLRPSLGHTRYISWDFTSLGALLFAVSLCYSYPLAFFQIPSVAPRRALAFHPNSPTHQNQTTADSPHLRPDAPASLHLSHARSAPVRLLRIYHRIDVDICIHIRAPAPHLRISFQLHRA